ncbi:hypothetical protein CSUB_C0019 [Candidatus Caldarchaeum subterraneum]|uniref:Uncharacterized protein n=2 Tax=Caldiarchaeum subterraneum TaxID=311458 RepID=E6N433_CALS0|nr:hypothetical protein HGMM_F51C10C07 [Candidatus Caldarchaeum subterraneum]BAJ49888.1 hypothetical protein CSUB_C0019 [Candidatus Caldarchaeum subterraneum]
MKVLLAAMDETGVAAAAKLAKQGFQTVFYTPDPYVEKKASEYNPSLHRGMSKQEFIKLCAENKLTVTRQPEKSYQEVWITVNTIKEGRDTLHSAENLVKTVGEKLRQAERLTVSGLTKPGECRHLLNLFTRSSAADPTETNYVGAVSATGKLLPAWSSSEKTSPVLEKLGATFFQSPELAEIASLWNILSEAVEAWTLIEMAILHGHKELVMNCFTREAVLYHEHLDAVKAYRMQRDTPLLNNLYTKMRKTVYRAEASVLSQVREVSRKYRREFRLLVVGCPEMVGERFVDALKGRRVKVSVVDAEDVSPEKLGSFTGFDGVVVAGLRIDMLRELSKHFSYVWFVPTV